MSLIEKVLTSHTGAKEREDWQQQAWASFRKYRGAFGPIVEKEVESAFFTALATGAEYGGHLEFSRLTKERGVRFPPLFGQIPSTKIDRLREEASALNNLLTAATPESVPWTQSVVARVNALNAILNHKLIAPGPPPWKVEDAFEVWLTNRHHGAKVEAQARFSMHDAFLAGAEYGAAAGSEGGPSENRTDAPFSGERGASVGGEPPEGRYSSIGGTAVRTDRRPMGDKAAFVPVPKDFWKMLRARDLAQAVFEFIQNDDGAAIERGDNLDPVGEWINELRELWETM